ncbi:ornithine cyclodeaminase family protein [Acidaminobacter sp. JC074]|uniref:ornithine cyclodeaminase family protein n=1 Tax=Acidaminobacter sp. JC074 TaxID=2530199 RepID=UPI001F114A43|nr:ornithine cyclodeaminase family protein [Acidaminobacter sp. JC074]
MSSKVEFLYLQQEDCIKAGGLDMAGCMKATERSFFLHGKKAFIQPGKPVIRWGGPETEETTGRIMSMPSYLGGQEYEEELKERDLLGPVNTSGIKWIPSKPHNPSKYNLPRANAVITIVDPDTLMPVCIMDGTVVSAMRTGAASGVAAKYLANPDSKVMGLVGASVQGKTQAMAIKAGVPSLEVLKVFDINRATSEKFVEEMKDQLGMELVVVDSAEEAFRGSDVISTATMAKEPYVKAEWYKEGALHCEISFWDTPAEALKIMDKVVVDDWYQVSHHGVDVSYRAVRDGVISEDKILGNMGDIVVGNIPGRQSKSERIFFNPIGMGIHDLSEAFRVYENAKEMGIGRKLPLWENPALV